MNANIPNTLWSHHLLLYIVSKHILGACYLLRLALQAVSTAGEGMESLLRRANSLDMEEVNR